LTLAAHELPDLIAGIQVLAGALVIDMSVKHLLAELRGRQDSR
jgi:F0F1-type ATP synthase delta subunit